MSQHGRFQGQMAGTDRLLGGPPPAVGRIGQEKTWGRMTPNFERGTKRGAMGGAAGAIMGQIQKIARSATVEGPEVRQTHDSPENQPIVVKRKIAQNGMLYSQESNLQYFLIFVHPAVDEYNPATDYAGETEDGYKRRFLVDTRDGVEHRDVTYVQKSIGGRTTFLYWHISMAEMNFILQSQERRAHPKRGDMTISEAMGTWRLDGVLNNKKHNYDKYGKWNRTGDDAYVTVDQYNLTYCVNYWGKEAVKGVALFLIFKRLDRSKLPLKPNKYVLGVKNGAEEYATPELTEEVDTLDGSMDGGVRGVIGADKLKLARKPFQIIPYAKHGFDQPPIKELEYIDNHNIARIASYMRVGIVHRGSSKITRREYFERAHYDDYAAMRLPRIWIFLGL